MCVAGRAGTEVDGVEAAGREVGDVRPSLLRLDREPPGRTQLLMKRRPRIEVILVDVRERELTIKGQEILTSDKVAIRVSIVVQFRVTDPAAAIERVAEYEDRLYSDVQLAARRSLASMTLEDILTNRTRLSEDILAEVLDRVRAVRVDDPPRRRQQELDEGRPAPGRPVVRPRHDEVRGAVDPDRQEVRTVEGETISYDALLVATGVDVSSFDAQLYCSWRD